MWGCLALSVKREQSEEHPIFTSSLLLAAFSSQIWTDAYFPKTESPNSKALTLFSVSLLAIRVCTCDTDWEREHNELWVCLGKRQSIHIDRIRQRSRRKLSHDHSQGWDSRKLMKYLWIMNITYGSQNCCSFILCRYLIYIAGYSLLLKPKSNYFSVWGSGAEKMTFSWQR